MKDRTALKIENLTVNYGGNIVLSDIQLNVEDGEYLGIIGPNGGGKTTLLKAILGLVQPAAGMISVYGASRYGGTGVQDLRGVRIGYVPQVSEFDREFPITVHEVVLTGKLSGSISLFHRYTPSDRKYADEMLESVGISGLARRRICELSGGEFQKMLIARALVLEPKLLLLDEPTANIDAGSQEQIYRLFAGLSGKMTIIMVTHDLLAISSQVKRIACLNRSLIYHGSTELSEDVVNKLYGCPVDLIAHGVPHRVLKEHDRKGVVGKNGQ